MRRIVLTAFALLAVSAAALAQQWEFGGSGGASFLSNVNVAGPGGSATAGYQSGGAFGGFLGEEIRPHWSGEIHYAYFADDLHILSGPTNATFAGNAQVVHYDMLYHTGGAHSRVQGFVAVGGGVKFFRGNGTPEAYQPNYQFGYLTATQQTKPMGDVGFGVRFQLAPHLYLRTEIRDYITAFPTAIIAPAPNTHYGSILNDLVPMVTLMYTHQGISNDPPEFSGMDK